MDYEQIEALRERHSAWRLLRAGNASLVLSFLGAYFVESNRGASSASEVTSALDDHLYSLNAQEIDGEPRYPREPRAYLEDWSAPESGYLRRFYPTRDDEVHYEVTPSFEKAYAWVTSLPGRAFVGTESRLHTVVELLRQIVHGTETNPDVRLAELRRRRDEIDAEIAAAEAGDVAMLDPASVRDRYQQASATARDLLSDFREVEENFRALDRAARERIATWDGGKGELLADLVGSRSHITGSDQGRSFQAFYDFLLSDERQRELTDLLARVSELDAVDADRRMRGIHHDWAEAAERTQRTVRQISEQLRRFLDDQVWLENRRVLDLVRAIEATALEIRHHAPHAGLIVDVPGIDIVMPFDRPLYQAPTTVDVVSSISASDDAADPDLLFTQSYVDPHRLAQSIRAIVPPRSTVLLSDVIALYPIEQGAAEIVGYLALDADDLDIEVDAAAEALLEYGDPDDPGTTRRVRLPRVTVHRR